MQKLIMVCPFVMAKFPFAKTDILNYLYRCNELEVKHINYCHYGKERVQSKSHDVCAPACGINRKSLAGLSYEGMGTLQAR